MIDGALVNADDAVLTPDKKALTVAAAARLDALNAGALASAQAAPVLIATFCMGRRCAGPFAMETLS